MTRLHFKAASSVLVVAAIVAMFAAHRGDRGLAAVTPGVVELFVAPGSRGGDGTAAHPAASPKAAMDIAGTRACVVRLAAGRYDVAGLDVPAGSKIQWQGTRGREGSDLAASTVLVGPVAVHGRDVAFSDLIFDQPAPAGLKAGTSAVDTLLMIDHAGDVSFERCFFTGSADTAVRIEKCGHWSVTSSLFKNIYRGLFVTSSSNGRLVNCTLIDDRLGHGTNSLTTGRIEIRDSDHLVLFNNALSPRDPDGKILLLDGCGNDFHSDYNIWRGVITHQYGTEQQSTWQNNFRTLDSWQAHTAKMWGSACDAHSHSEPIDYCSCPIPGPDAKAIGETSGAGSGAAEFQGCSAPSTDLFGRATDHSIGCFNLVPPKVLPPFDPVPGVRIFSAKFPTAGRASVAVYAGDRLLQTLASGQLFDAGEHRFIWDGRDAAGQLVSMTNDVKFTWRAVLTPESPETFDIAGPGMKLAPGCTGTTLANNPQENGEGIWCDKDGNLYEVAPYDEAGSTILSVDKDGHYRWRNWQHNGHLVTGDAKYIYVIGDDKVEKNAVVVERFPLAGCDPVPWADGKIAMTLGTTDQIEPTGMSAANGKLYVSDGPRDRVVVFAVGSTRIEKQIPVPRPSGLFVREDGLLAVCTRAKKGDGHGVVTAFASTGAVVLQDDKTFSDPVDVTPGPNGSAYVADGGEGKNQQVIQWYIDPAVVGPLPAPTRIGDPGGYTGRDASSIVQPDRNLRINQIAGTPRSLWIGQKEPGYARSRLTRYDFEPWPAAPKLAAEILSLEGQNGSFADPRDPSFVYSPDFFRYHVDLATGQWDWDRNYDHVRWSTVCGQVGCSTGAIFYIGDKKFMGTTVVNSDTTNSRTVLISRFDGEKLIPCGAIGGRYFGSCFESKDFDPAKSGQWVWHAEHSDGVLKSEDVNFVKKGTKDGYPFSDLTWGTYVERDGTIVWPGESMHYLRPRGLDKTGTVPIYDWADAVTIKYQDFPERDEHYTARVDLDGSIYDLSSTKAQPLPPGYWGMGTVLTRLTPAGKRVWTVPVNLTAKGLAIDNKFVFVGSCFGPFINQYTKDGLLVRQFSEGNTDSQFGWFDFPTPINSVTDPKSGDSILTAEEQWMGRIMVFRVPGKVTRLAGDVPN